MVPRLRPLWVLLLAGLLLTACVTPPPPPPDQPRPLAAQEISSLINLGQERLAQGRYPEAGDAFRAAIKRGPFGEQGVAARLGLAKAEAGAGRWAEVLPPLKDLLAVGARPPQEVEARLLAARAEIQLGQNAAGADRLRGLLALGPLQISQAQRREALYLLASALAAQNQNAAAVAQLVNLANESPADQAEQLAGRIYELALKGPVRELQPLLGQARNVPARLALLLALGRLQAKAGQIEEAKALAAQVRETHPLPPEFRAKLEDLDQELTRAATLPPRAVGVILPLSGNFAAHGRQVLAAIELGLGMFSDPARAPVLYIEDDKGEAQAAAEAVTNLVETRKVMAIIGPLAAGPAVAAARQAQILGVPLVTLSQAEGITRAGDYVFQNFFSPADQVGALLEEIMERRGQQRLAVLAPRTTYGQGFVKIFDAGVLARGGQLTHTLWYDPSHTDFADYIRELTRMAPGVQRQPLGSRPQADFAALFVPDAPERVALIAPQLAYQGVSGVTLLGTSLLHSAKTLEMTGRSLEGALFPDAFDPSSRREMVVRFTSEFRQAMGRDPNVLDAHGFDSALLIRRALDQPEEPRTRRALRDVLAGMRGVGGVCGELSVDPERRVYKPLTLFTVQEGAFRPLSELDKGVGAPEAGGDPLIGPLRATPLIPVPQSR